MRDGAEIAFVEVKTRRGETAGRAEEAATLAEDALGRFPGDPKVQLAAGEEEEPVIVTAGALRVAARFNRNALGSKNQRSDGRISIAQLVGFGSGARKAHLALLQVGNDVCTPVQPDCASCPLVPWCQSADPLESRDQESEPAQGALL